MGHLTTAAAPASTSNVQMDDLVSLCLAFVAAHLPEVARTSADLAALPSDLLQRLAKASAAPHSAPSHTLYTPTGEQAHHAATLVVVHPPGVLRRW